MIDEQRTFTDISCTPEKMLSSNKIEYTYSVGPDTFDSEDNYAYEFDLTYNATYTIFSMLRFDSEGNLYMGQSYSGEEGHTEGEDNTDGTSEVENPGSTPEVRLNVMGWYLTNTDNMNKPEDPEVPEVPEDPEYPEVPEDPEYPEDVSPCESGSCNG